MISRFSIVRQLSEDHGRESPPELELGGGGPRLGRECAVDARAAWAGQARARPFGRSVQVELVGLCPVRSSSGESNQEQSGARDSRTAVGAALQPGAAMRSSPGRVCRVRVLSMAPGERSAVGWAAGPNWALGGFWARGRSGFAIRRCGWLAVLCCAVTGPGLGSRAGGDRTWCKGTAHSLLIDFKSRSPNRPCR